MKRVAIAAVLVVAMVLGVVAYATGAETARLPRGVDSNTTLPSGPTAVRATPTSPTMASVPVTTRF